MISNSRHFVNSQIEPIPTMEEITEGVTNITISADSQKKNNKIQVFNTQKSLFFYVNLSKRYMQHHSEMELSALGWRTTWLGVFYMCIPTGITEGYAYGRLGVLSSQINRALEMKDHLEPGKGTCDDEWM